MGFTELPDLDCSATTAIGGRDKKSGKNNPTSIEGYFIGTRSVPSAKSKSGFAALHIFNTPDGNIGVWGKTNLDSKMASVKPGTMTRVTFAGMVETKNNPMYKYRVEVDPSNTIEVLSTSTESPTSNEANAVAADDGLADDLDPYDDAPPVDEPTPTRASIPRAPAKAPDAARQARVQDLLNGNRKRATG